MHAIHASSTLDDGDYTARMFDGGDWPLPPLVLTLAYDSFLEACVADDAIPFSLTCAACGSTEGIQWIATDTRGGCVAFEHYFCPECRRYSQFYCADVEVEPLLYLIEQHMESLL